MSAFLKAFGATCAALAFAYGLPQFTWWLATVIPYEWRHEADVIFLFAAPAVLIFGIFFYGFKRKGTKR